MTATTTAGSRRTTVLAAIAVIGVAAIILAWFASRPLAGALVVLLVAILVIVSLLFSPREAATEAATRALTEEAQPPLTREELLAPRGEVPPARVSEGIEAVLSPAARRGADIPDDSDLDQWREDSSRGLAGVYRAEQLDEETQAITEEYRPTRSMDPAEQDELEDMLERTGQLDLFIDDGSPTSPARPRRGEGR